MTFGALVALVLPIWAAWALLRSWWGERPRELALLGLQVSLAVGLGLGLASFSLYLARWIGLSRGVYCLVDGLGFLVLGIVGHV
ncbi:MAG: hypothetical protein NZ700_13440, partial [Gemmataceae bacterium]|nr:hypothetical protein [Gemmataceae bacterium]MDW8266421.1 hypothetical protein [Gemmataceae bacterium]